MAGSTFLKGALAGGVGAAAVLSATAALAGTGIGGVFNLGQNNTVSAGSNLSTAVGGPWLGITNGSPGQNATGLRFTAAAGHPPLAVSSATRVANLNADRLDG